MKIFIGILVGLIVGFNLAKVAFNFPVKEITKQTEALTIKRTDLHHIVEAVGFLTNGNLSKNYNRFESTSGSIALECKTDEFCSLEAPAVQRPQIIAIKSDENNVTAPIAKEIVKEQPVSGVNKGTEVFQQLGLKNYETVILSEKEQAEMHRSDSDMKKALDNAKPLPENAD